MSNLCEECGADLLLSGMQHNENCPVFGPVGNTWWRHDGCQIRYKAGLSVCETCEPPTSDRYTWKRNAWPGAKGYEEDEVFEAHSQTYNITRAKLIVFKAPRLIEYIPMHVLATILDLLVDLDPPKKGRDYDVTFPLIVATLKSGGRLPIDGWHRIDKARKMGLRELPAVILTLEETRLVRRK